jgi:hypothetical protein
MTTYKTIQKLRARAMTFPDAKKKQALEVLADEERDLAIWPNLYRQILADATSAVDAIEEDDEIE